MGIDQQGNRITGLRKPSSKDGDLLDIREDRSRRGKVRLVRQTPDLFRRDAASTDPAAP